MGPQCPQDENALQIVVLTEMLEVYLLAPGHIIVFIRKQFSSFCEVAASPLFGVGRENVLPFPLTCLNSATSTISFLFPDE